MKNKKNSNNKHIAKYLTLPFQMLAIIGLGVFGGIKLDEICKFNSPIFTLLLTLIAVALSIYYAIKDLIK